MSKKAVVTGGAGFIGCHIVEALLEKGFEVHIVDNFAGGRKEERINPKATLHETDIRNLEELKQVFTGADYVFHTAALPRVQFSIEQPVETTEVNINGTMNVLIAAHDAGVKKVVYSASSSAYGDQDVMPLHEELPAHPKSPYGLQKYVGELLCRTWSEVYGVPTVSLRYFNVYGPKHDPDGAYALVIGKFLKQCREGGPMTITGDGKQTRDFTHVRDVVHANILAAQSNVTNGEVINVGAGNNVSIKNIAEMIGDNIEYVEARLEPHDTLADNTKAKKLIGWEPTVSIEEGIAELKKEYL